MYINFILKRIGLMVLLAWTFPSIASQSFISFYNHPDHKNYQALLRAILVLGGDQVPSKFLMGLLEKTKDNQPFLLKKNLEFLQEKKVIKLSYEKGDMFISLSFDDKDASFVFKDREELKKILGKAVHFFQETFNKDWESLIAYTMERPYIVPIAEHFFQISKRFHFNYPEIPDIQIHLLEYYMYATRQHDKAKLLLKEIEGNPYFNDLPYGLKALFISNKANLLSTHFAKDKKLLKQLFQELQQAFTYFIKNKNFNEALRMLSCWSQVHLLQGEIKQAMKRLKDGEKLLPKVEKHRYKAIFYYIKAWCFIEAGDYEKSLACANEAIFCLEKLHVTPLLFFSYNLKSDALFCLKRFKDAYETAFLSLEKAKHFQPGKAADWKAEAMVTLAKSSLELQQHPVALRYIQEAEQAYEAFFHGSDIHIDQAAVQTTKGQILMKEERFHQARHAFETAVAIYQKLTVANVWFDEMGIVYEWLILACQKLNQMDDMFYYYKKHVQQFGKKHPRTLRIEGYFQKIPSRE